MLGEKPCINCSICFVPLVSSWLPVENLPFGIGNAHERVPWSWELPCGITLHQWNQQTPFVLKMGKNPTNNLVLKVGCGLLNAC